MRSQKDPEQKKSSPPRPAIVITPAPLALAADMDVEESEMKITDRERLEQEQRDLEAGIAASVAAEQILEAKIVHYAEEPCRQSLPKHLELLMLGGGTLSELTALIIFLATDNKGKVQGVSIALAAVGLVFLAIAAGFKIQMACDKRDARRNRHFDLKEERAEPLLQEEKERFQVLCNQAKLPVLELPNDGSAIKERIFLLKDNKEKSEKKLVISKNNALLRNSLFAALQEHLPVVLNSIVYGYAKEALEADGSLSLRK